MRLWSEKLLKQENKGDFPAEWGKILGVGYGGDEYGIDGRATCTPNEKRDDWLYAWSIHFENGVLGVLVGKEADAVSIDQSLFEYDGWTKSNTVYYDNSQSWHNAYGGDGGSTYGWYRIISGVMSRIGSSLVSTYAKLGWNNGTNSIWTDVFTFEVQNNGKMLVVNKNGTFFGRYTVSG